MGCPFCISRKQVVILGIIIRYYTIKKGPFFNNNISKWF